jgi:hypothetical protein
MFLWKTIAAVTMTVVKLKPAIVHALSLTAVSANSTCAHIGIVKEDKTCN